jgi:hypothetical protein
MEIEIGHYILNPQQQGKESGKNYELHNADTCAHLPDKIHQLSLGHFNTCELALEEAHRRVPKWVDLIDGCAWCCPNCHKG